MVLSPLRSSQAKGTKSTSFLTCVRNEVDLVPLACEDAPTPPHPQWVRLLSGSVVASSLFIVAHIVFVFGPCFGMQYLIVISCFAIILLRKRGLVALV